MSLGGVILSVAVSVARMAGAVSVPLGWRSGWQRDASEVAAGLPAGWQSEYQPGFHHCFRQG